MGKKLTMTFLFVGILLVPAAGLADEDAAGTGAAADPAILETLSPGDRVIARALFDAQAVAPAKSTGASGVWSLRRIATERAAGTGWGDIFDRMKSAGLLRAADLGEVVERYHPPPSLLPPMPRPPARPVVITSGMNSVSLVPRARRFIDWDTAKYPSPPRALPVSAVTGADGPAAAGSGR